MPRSVSDDCSQYCRWGPLDSKDLAGYTKLLKIQVQTENSSLFTFSCWGSSPWAALTHLTTLLHTGASDKKQNTHFTSGFTLGIYQTASCPLNTQYTINLCRSGSSWAKSHLHDFLCSFPCHLANKSCFLWTAWSIWSRTALICMSRASVLLDYWSIGLSSHYPGD